jgi:glutamyl-tRNA reductase
LITYNEILVKLDKLLDSTYGVKYSDDLQVIRAEIMKLMDDIKERNKESVSKTLRTRNSSNRAKRLHNVDNKLRYARKKNNVEAIKRYEEEMDYIKKNIFD